MTLQSRCLEDRIREKKKLFSIKPKPLYLEKAFPSLERSFDESWNGYMLKFEAGLIIDNRHVSKSHLASPSDFTTLIETFITNNLISLPF